MRTGSVIKLYEILEMVKTNKPVPANTLSWGFSILDEELKKLENRRKIFSDSLNAIKNEGIGE